MKTRVVKENDRFYPQYRWMFIWCYFSNSWYTVYWDTLEEAIDFLDRHFVRHSKVPPRIIIPHYSYCKRTDYTGPK